MTPTAEATIEELAERYGAAWNEHDLDAIMGMHAEDSVFQLNLGGAPEIRGTEATPTEGGLVKRKDTYLDLVAAQQQLGLLED